MRYTCVSVLLLCRVMTVINASDAQRRLDWTWVEERGEFVYFKDPPPSPPPLLPPSPSPPPASPPGSPELAFMLPVTWHEIREVELVGGLLTALCVALVLCRSGIFGRISAWYISMGRTPKAARDSSRDKARREGSIAENSMILVPSRAKEPTPHSDYEKEDGDGAPFKVGIQRGTRISALAANFSPSKIERGKNVNSAIDALELGVPVAAADTNASERSMWASWTSWSPFRYGPLDLLKLPGYLLSSPNPTPTAQEKLTFDDSSGKTML